MKITMTKMCISSYNGLKARESSETSERQLMAKAIRKKMKWREIMTKWRKSVSEESAIS